MANEKAPAFQCYARDSITDTSACTLAETGVYFKLRCWTWLNGPVPLERLHLILGVPQAQARKLWAAVAPFWHETPEGWVAPDLETQRRGLAAFFDSQKMKASKGGLALAAKRARGPARGTAPGLPGALPEPVPGRLPGTLPEPCPDSAPALCSLQDQDQNQDQDQSLRDTVPVQNPVENDNPRVLLRLAHDVIDEQIGGAFAAEHLEEVFEKRAARLGLNYAGDRTRKALESAQVQRANGRRAR